MKVLGITALTAFLLPFTLFGGWWSAYDPKTLAMIKVPVADMLVLPASTYTKAGASGLYHNLPLSSKSSAFPSVRAHQSLMNEVLYKAHVKDGEIFGVIPNAWFGVHKETGKPLMGYITAACHAVLLSDLLEKKLPLNLIPRPVWLGRSDSSSDDNSILTLIMPWQDQSTSRRLMNNRFSVGTRFVRIPRYDTDTEYAVSYIDFKQMVSVVSFVPKDRALVGADSNKQNARFRFLAMLRRLADSNRYGLVPYVLGGSSFVGGYPEEDGVLVNRKVLGRNARKIYVRNKKTSVHSGFDCSELVWRVPQLVGIPFFCKNTFTMDRFLTPLAPDESVKKGDLLWVPGHVMVIDADNNMLIESAGYSSGYGRVQRIALKDRLGLNTVNDVVKAYREKRPIKLLSKEGKEKRHYDWKILKFFEE